ncbi:Stemmadenine O-acetyltransferase [Camellia lanceoleosa]|uniref:Stemmadenine O-acetyltransferase n=1 Tax=Camellia lanceoleosa TaxID=1840588 RepID=A0ACC0GQ44_9ERIC|nr:Stemmadenine O-acetyltransferase [Camellia lanceoleosa]
MKVVVTSKQTIKPSNQTLHYLCQLKLSFLDQKQQPYFVLFVYFYASRLNKAISVRRRSEKLKKSLSKTLSWFYPLVGRVKDNLFVDYNNEGMPFFEAQVESNLDHVVGQSNYKSQFNNLFPYHDFDDASDLLLAVQVNFFHCGGMAIGLCTSYKIADALSVVMFMKFWAAVSLGDHSNLVYPQFGLANIFPPTLNPNTNHHKYGVGTTKNKIIAKSFMFNNFTISTLKTKYTPTTTTATTVTANNKTIHNNPTHVEALSTFIWCRYMAATRGETVCREGITFLVNQGVNLCTKFNPLLPNSYYGNLSQVAMLLLAPLPLKKDASGEDCGSLVTQMRDGIRKVYNDFVRKLQEGGGGGMEGLNSKKDEGGGDGGVSGMKGLNSKKKEGGNKRGGEVVFSLMFSSLARFPLYETDFEWGRPVWVTFGVASLDNTVVFFPTRSGDGIEALIFSNEGDLAKREVDKEFLSFVPLLLTTRKLTFCVYFFATVYLTVAKNIQHFPRMICKSLRHTSHLYDSPVSKDMDKD